MFVDFSNIKSDNTYDQKNKNEEHYIYYNFILYIKCIENIYLCKYIRK